MWSEPGSGFEANQYSPAGRMQRQWWFLRRAGQLSDRELAERAGWALRAALPVMVAVLVLFGVTTLLSMVLPTGASAVVVVLAAVAWVITIERRR
jgi:hypothetical protein